MLVVICYDIADNRRRRKVAALLEGYGTRAQESLFECWLDAQQFRLISSELQQLIDHHEDRVRLYRLCGKDAALIIPLGLATAPRDIVCHIV